MQLAQRERIRKSQEPTLVFFDFQTHVANTGVSGVVLNWHGQTVNFTSAGANFPTARWHWQDALTRLVVQCNVRTRFLSHGNVASVRATQNHACLSVKKYQRISDFSPLKRHGRYPNISLGKGSIAPKCVVTTCQYNQSLLWQQSLATGPDTNHVNVSSWILAKAKSPTMGVHLSETALQANSGQSGIGPGLGVGSMLLSYKKHCKGES